MGRTKHIDVILRDASQTASAAVVVEFYQALNTLVEGHTYLVNLRVVAEKSVGGPLHWTGRTAVFWGDLENSWNFDDRERSWTSQVLSLSSRTVFVGGAVLLLAKFGLDNSTPVAVHPNFQAAAMEHGLADCGAGTCRAGDGKVNSATTRLSALRLLSEFVSSDHGEHLAAELRSYIGLAEPMQKFESQIAARLIRRAKGDQMVVRVLDEMLRNIEDPLKIPDLSELVQTSTRQLQRRFLNRTGAKLLTTYTELRLERARSLLRYTDMPLIEISTATGFSSTVAMARAFFNVYRIRPESIRNQRFVGALEGRSTMTRAQG